MKLVFYSGGDEEDNLALDTEVLKLVGKKSVTLTFIPSSSIFGEIEFQEFINQYRRFGIKKFFYFPIDQPFDEVKAKRIFESDLIHLGGGNTYFFLQTIQRKKLKKRFIEYVKNGGILTGLSAGAIIMTPKISTAGYPHFDRDDNFINLKRLDGLKLSRFEFFPHYQNSEKYRNVLLRESRKINYPLYAAKDGSGIIQNGNHLHFIGKIWIFNQGRCQRVI